MAVLSKSVKTAATSKGAKAKAVVKKAKKEPAVSSISAAVANRAKKGKAPPAAADKETEAKTPATSKKSSSKKSSPNKKKTSAKKKKSTPSTSRESSEASASSADEEGKERPARIVLEYNDDKHYENAKTKNTDHAKELQFIKSLLAIVQPIEVGSKGMVERSYLVRADVKDGTVFAVAAALQPLVQDFTRVLPATVVAQLVQALSHTGKLKTVPVNYLTIAARLLVTWFWIPSCNEDQRAEAISALNNIMGRLNPRDEVPAGSPISLGVDVLFVVCFALERASKPAAEGTASLSYLSRMEAQVATGSDKTFYKTILNYGVLCYAYLTGNVKQAAQAKAFEESIMKSLDGNAHSDSDVRNDDLNLVRRHVAICINVTQTIFQKGDAVPHRAEYVRDAATRHLVCMATDALLEDYVDEKKKTEVVKKPDVGGSESVVVRVHAGRAQGTDFEASKANGFGEAGRNHGRGSGGRGAGRGGRPHYDADEPQGEAGKPGTTDQGSINGVPVDGAALFANAVVKGNAYCPGDTVAFLRAHYPNMTPQDRGLVLDGVRERGFYSRKK